MRRSSSVRPSRSFRPTSLGLVRLETLRLLDAGAATVMPMAAPTAEPTYPSSYPGTGTGSTAMSSTLAAAIAAVNDDLAQLKEEIQNYKLDYIIYQNDVNGWRLDRNFHNGEVSDLRTDPRAYNDEYHPKRLSIKTTTEIDAQTGQPVAKLVIDFDHSGIGRSLLPKAQEDLNKLQDRTAALNAEKKTLDQRKADLGTRGDDLKKRWDDLMKRKAEILQKEQGVQMQAYYENAGPVTFDNSGLDAEDPSMVVMSVKMDRDAIDTFQPMDFDNSMYYGYPGSGGV